MASVLLEVSRIESHPPTPEQSSQRYPHHLREWIPGKFRAQYLKSHLHLRLLVIRAGNQDPANMQLCFFEPQNIAM